MSHNTPESSNPPSSSMEHDSHHDAHVHGLRLALGSILAPKRPSPPSHSGSYPASGTSSPFHHWQHHPGGPVTGTSTGHDTPPLASSSSSSPPHASPVLPLHQPHFQQPHHPTPSMHSHLNFQHHAHVHPQQPQPQPQPHTHAYGHSRLGFTHSSGSTPSESLSPSPTPSPRLTTPPPTLEHAPHAYPHEHAVSDPSPINTVGGATNADAADPKRARFLKTLQSKSAWDAMIHGSWV
jgi:hypothetical protein